MFSEKIFSKASETSLSGFLGFVSRTRIAQSKRRAATNSARLLTVGFDCDGIRLVQGSFNSQSTGIFDCFRRHLPCPVWRVQRPLLPHLSPLGLCCLLMAQMQILACPRL